MFEILACVGGATLAVMYLRSMMKRYYYLQSFHKNYTSMRPIVRSRPISRRNVNYIDSIEYPSSTYVTARLPHMYLRDFHI